MFSMFKVTTYVRTVTTFTIMCNDIRKIQRLLPWEITPVIKTRNINAYPVQVIGDVLRTNRQLKHRWCWLALGPFRSLIMTKGLLAKDLIKATLLPGRFLHFYFNILYSYKRDTRPDWVDEGRDVYVRFSNCDAHNLLCDVNATSTLLTQQFALLQSCAVWMCLAQPAFTVWWSGIVPLVFHRMGRCYFASA